MTGRRERLGKRQPASNADTAEAVCRIAALGYVVLWLMGFGGLWFPIIALMCVPVLIRANRLPGAVRGILALPVLLMASTVVGGLSYGFDADRLLGVAANSSVWITLAGVFAYFWSRRDAAKHALRWFVVLAIFQAMVTIAAEVRYPEPLGVPLFGDIASQISSSLGAFGDDRIYYQDWLGGVAFRSIGIMGNPTWAGAFAATAVLICIFAPKNTLGYPLRLLGVLAGAYSIDLSLSRSTIACLVGAILIGLVALQRNARPFAYLVGSSVLFLGIVAILLAASTQISTEIAEINSSREGSLTTRSEIYAATWAGILQHPVPLIGYGIKPQYNHLGASVATHSTYLGILFRAGISGLIVTVGLYLAAYFRGLRAGSGLATGLAAFCAAWSILEDVDPGHLVPISLVLAICSLEREKGATSAEVRVDS